MLLPENSAIAEKVTKITLHKFPPFLYLLHPALGILYLDKDVGNSNRGCSSGKLEPKRRYHGRRQVKKFLEFEVSTIQHFRGRGHYGAHHTPPICSLMVLILVPCSLM
jgi:hypothetical protein